MKPRQATIDEVLRAHRAELLDRLRQPIDFDTDTPYYPGIDEHARRAAGAAILSVDLALRGKESFSLMRPPGHHATATKAMGFCYLNSIGWFRCFRRGSSYRFRLTVRRLRRFRATTQRNRATNRGHFGRRLQPPITDVSGSLSSCMDAMISKRHYSGGL
jgi:hypothetical protein